MSEHENAAKGDHGGGGGGGHGGGHKKKHHHAGHGAHEEHEEGWIVSFADNVLLMMGFFVILLAMNMGPKAVGPEVDGQPGGAAGPSDHMLDFAIAMREAFHNPVQLDSTNPEDEALIRRLRQRAGLSPSSESRSEVTQARGTPTDRPADWHGLSGHVEFGDQSTDLTEAARKTIADLSTRIVGTRWIVEVRGHSSKLESLGDERRARELSYQRAFAVGHALVLSGARWEQIQLVASGDIAPVTPRASTVSEHMTNQRVEIILTPLTEARDPYSQQPLGERSADDAGGRR
jgi:flagellar motor protein MotB